VIAPLRAVTGSRVREHFLADHRKLEDLLRQVLLAFEDDDRERVAAVWTLFDAQLLAHLDAEERHLFPALLRADERDGRALLEEHKHIRRRLMELGAEVDLHTVRLTEARGFIDELKAHAAHEDAILYAWADEHVDAGKRASALAALVDSLKGRLLARAGALF
jgi:hemerythrin-like domain-containing protein